MQGLLEVTLASSSFVSFDTPSIGMESVGYLNC